jgi:uncharacterized protein (DUF924 family)
MSTPDDVLDFWLGNISADDTVEETTSKRWWKKDPAFDDLIREKFGDDHARAARGELDAWAETPRGRVALVILLDQFSRNLFRNDPRSFAQDPKALALTEAAVDADEPSRLRGPEIYFLLMPFMHSESLAAQDRGIEQFGAAAARATSEGSKKMLSGAAHYAKLHRDIVQRFGRFPHRNALLGRESTAEEIEFLKQPNSSF